MLRGSGNDFSKKSFDKYIVSALIRAGFVTAKAWIVMMKDV